MARIGLVAHDLKKDDLVGNMMRAFIHENNYQLGKAGKPIDPEEWGMTPQTINAYYNPGFNEIVFPAAILQYPFFDASRDAAANYGAIGAVIGHEIGHGFDDQGSGFDGDGRLTDWWTEADRAAFEERTKALKGFSAEDDRYVAMDLDNPLIDYPGLARSLGVPGERVEKAVDVGPAVARALASGGPALIDVRVDPSFT